MRILPPRIDTEKVEKAGDKEHPTSLEARDQVQSEVQLITVGCNRGSIIFLSTLDPTQVYARIGYHREQVQHLYEMRKGHQ